MNRRGFLKIGLAAPAVILTPGLLMPVVEFWKPKLIVLGDITVESFGSIGTLDLTYRWIAYEGILKHLATGWEVVSLGPTPKHLHLLKRSNAPR